MLIATEIEEAMNDPDQEFLEAARDHSADCDHEWCRIRLARLKAAYDIVNLMWESPVMIRLYDDAPDWAVPETSEWVIAQIDANFYGDPHDPRNRPKFRVV